MLAPMLVTGISGLSNHNSSDQNSETWGTLQNINKSRKWRDRKENIQAK